MSAVVRVITRLNIGGPARHVLTLTAELADEFPTTLVAGTPPAQEGELLDPRVPVTRVPLVRAPDPRRDIAALRALRHILAAEQPRIVHTHMAKAGALGRIAAWRTAAARVHTFHGHVLEGYFPPVVQRAFVLAERALARRTDVLVTVSEHVKEDLLQLGIGRPEQYRVIPLGLDLTGHLAANGPSGALRGRLGLSADTPLLGCVGRLVPIKDHHTLLDALTRIPDVHLALLGDGKSRTALEAHAESLGVNRRVHFAGWWHDMPSAIADMDLVVLTSRNEGTPVALIEAHACAKAAVSTRVGGVPAVVRDGETGLLVPPGDPGATAEAITTLLSDPARRAAMGEAGRAHVRRRYSKERLVADIRALYRELSTP